MAGAAGAATAGADTAAGALSSKESDVGSGNSPALGRVGLVLMTERLEVAVGLGPLVGMGSGWPTKPSWVAKLGSTFVSTLATVLTAIFIASSTAVDTVRRSSDTSFLARSKRLRHLLEQVFASALPWKGLSQL